MTVGFVVCWMLGSHAANTMAAAVSKRRCIERPLPGYGGSLLSGADDALNQLRKDAIHRVDGTPHHDSATHDQQEQRERRQPLEGLPGRAALVRHEVLDDAAAVERRHRQ